MRNKIIVLSLLACALLAGILIFLRQRRDLQMRGVALAPSAVAVGMRENIAVQRPLSFTQKKRLQEHFLDVPLTVPGSFNASEHTAPAVVDQVNRINALNNSQAEQR